MIGREQCSKSQESVRMEEVSRGSLRTVRMEVCQVLLAKRLEDKQKCKFRNDTKQG